MPTASAKTAQDNDYAIGWITDIGRYDAVPRCSAKDIPFTRLKQAHIDRMIELDLLKEIAPEKAKGGINLFGVVEINKERIRPIKETSSINSACGPETLMDVDMATKQQTVAMVRKAKYFAQFDAAAWFDQFPITEEIGCLMCCQKNGKFLRATTSPMGQRQSVEVAHTTTRRLQDMPGSKSNALAIIDNALFFHEEREAVRHDAVEFVKRVNEIGAKLNEDVSDIDSHVLQQGDWNGVHFDLVEKYVCMTDRVLDKLRLSWANRANWSCRNLFAHYGLLLWSIGLVDVNPGEYFDALKFYTNICRSVTDCHREGSQKKLNAFMEEPAVVWHDVWPHLTAWTEAVMLNPRRYLTLEACAPATDAVLSFSVRARRRDRTVADYYSSGGLANFRIAREPIHFPTGCFRGAVALPRLFVLFIGTCEMAPASLSTVSRLM